MPKRKDPQQPAPPRLHVRTRFHDNIDGVMYALVTAEMYMLSGHGHEQDAGTAEAEGDTALATLHREVAHEHREIARKYRREGLAEAERLYAIKEQDMPPIDERVAAFVSDWSRLGFTITEVGKQIARDEGLSEEHAERRMVYTLAQWR